MNVQKTGLSTYQETPTTSTYFFFWEKEKVSKKKTDSGSAFRFGSAHPCFRVIRLSQLLKEFVCAAGSEKVVLYDG